MKKYIFLLTLGILSFLMVNAQKENGVVYVEHDAIGKTKAMWDAFMKGDKTAFTNFFADTVWVATNGNFSKKLKSEMAAPMDWWSGFENLKITDAKPAYPDAIDYKKGGLWVQDWLRITGTHKNTGLNIDLPVHSLYAFNKDGKIHTFIEYFDNDLFDEIYKSHRTFQNGVVYNYHPYINTVRKAVNAYCAKDLETLLSFYTPDAAFSSLSLKDGEFINLEAKTNEFKKTFADYNTINLEQSGHPVCVCYENEYYFVYSWWVLAVTTEDGKKFSKIPVMFTHSFDNDGKIIAESAYMSSNHFD